MQGFTQRSVLRSALPRLALVLLLGALLVAPAGAGEVTGIAVYVGQIPQLPTLDMGADPQCAAKHDGPVTSDVLVTGDRVTGDRITGDRVTGEEHGDGHTLGNVFVQIVGTVPDVPPAGDKAILDQTGCRYEPRVLGIRAGQALEVRNSDGIMHNVHFLPKANEEKNLAMPPFLEKIDVEFVEPEPAFPVKCDIHPWMKAWIAVMEHPFFAVTATDGSYAIDGLPAGDYEVVAWHEKLGKRSQKVTVPEDGAATADFSFSR